MPYTDVLQYGDDVRQELARNGLPSEVSKVRVIVLDRKRAVRGLVIIEGISLYNGATLGVEENISVAAGRIIRHKYSYHFERGQYFFRYDKDIEAAQGREYAHAVCHLHVSGADHVDMRYISHETSFEEVFRFILASFPTP